MNITPSRNFPRLLTLPKLLINHSRRHRQQIPQRLLQILMVQLLRCFLDHHLITTIKIDTNLALKFVNLALVYELNNACFVLAFDLPVFARSELDAAKNDGEVTFLDLSY